MPARDMGTSFQLVVAATRKLGIGNAGTLPWSLPGDMAYFKELTTRTLDPAKQNAVIMGRRTWESIPPKFRPLAGRLNIVLSRSQSQEELANGHANGQNQDWKTAAEQDGVQIHSSLEAALAQLDSTESIKKPEMVFVIGGGQVYKDALSMRQCSAIHFTQIEEDIECDTFFPAIDRSRWRLWSASPPKQQKGLEYSFLCYVTAGAEAEPQLPAGLHSRHEEYQYLEMVEDVIENGAFREDRTGTGTYSLFGRQMRFNLRHSFPLLTTKRVFWRGVAEELFWFLKGSTNAKHLKDKGIHIWDGNSSREYLDSVGLKDREENDLGPVYGFQWRHFGASYSDMHANYEGQGVDQLCEVVHKLRTKPTDRRIILSAWNPAALHEMALPPCHMFAQFYVANGELSCQMYQRSADLGLGVPFNIASYALLTCLLAKVTGLQPGEFVHVLGDAHVYANHVEPLKEQLKNTPKPFPVLHIRGEKKEIEEYSLEDLDLQDYLPHKKIAMLMAV